MGSGSGWGMVIGFVVGAAFVIATGGAGAALWTTAMWTGAAVGGAIGGLIGGIIDPMEFPQQPGTEPQRLEELSIMGVQEGAGVTKAYGDSIRLAGQLIAVGNLIETKHTAHNPVGGGGKKSFLSGTPILVEDGSEVAIEEIMPNDKVRTVKFGKNGKLRYRNRRVSKIWRGTTSRALRVKGKEFDFTCTPEHEVYGLKPDKDAHWFTASSLRAGDSLLSEEGWVLVTSCDRFEIDAPTYNLTVEDDANYFADGILVHNSGGGGGGTTETTTWYTYSTDLAIAICEGPIHSVHGVWFNGKKKYTKSDTLVIQAGEDGVTSITAQYQIKGMGGTCGDAAFAYYVRLTFGGTPDFTKWASGLYATSSSSSGSNWNGNTCKIHDVNETAKTITLVVTGSNAWNGECSNISGGVVAQYTHTISQFGNVTTTTGSGGTLFGNWHSLSTHNSASGAKLKTATNAFDATIANAFRFYIGDDGNSSGSYYLGTTGVNDHYNNSLPDEVLTQEYPNSPAYRGICYCVIEQLELGGWGNQIPQTQFAINAIPREPEINSATETPYATLGQVLDTILIRQDLYKKNGVGGAYTVGDKFNTDAFQYDTTVDDTHSTNTKKRVRGYTSVGTKTAHQLIAALALRYDIIIAEQVGVLTFKERNTTTDITIQESHIGSYADPETSDNVPVLTVTDKENSDLPNEVNVDYYDVNDNYQRGSQKARKSISGIPRTQKHDLPMGLTATEAQTVANRLLYQTHAQRKRCSFTLPASYINIDEADLLAISIKGEGYSVRVMELNRGANFVHEISAVIEGSESVPYDGEADEDEVVDETYSPPPMELIVFDCPALTPEGIIQAGHYAATCTIEEDKLFKTAEIWRSDTYDGLYEQQQLMPEEGMLFQIEETPLASGPIGVWDNSTELTIRLKGPTSTISPPSVEDIDVLEGKSYVYVGGELIGFKTVTDSGDRVVVLTGLTRGQRGTGKYTGTHSAGEVGVIVSYDDSSGIASLDYTNDHVGSTKFYKSVSQGETLSDVNAMAAYASGNRLKPFPVAGIRGYKKDAAASSLPDAWIVDFARADRALFRLFSFAGMPNTDGTEGYICEIFKTSDTDTVIRTLTSETDTSGLSGISITQYDASGDMSLFPRVTYTNADQITDLMTAETSIVVAIYKVGTFISEGNYTLQTITNTRDYE